MRAAALLRLSKFRIHCARLAAVFVARAQLIHLNNPSFRPKRLMTPYKLTQTTANHRHHPIADDFGVGSEERECERSPVGKPFETDCSTFIETQLPYPAPITSRFKRGEKKKLIVQFVSVCNQSPLRRACMCSVYKVLLLLLLCFFYETTTRWIR